MKHIFVNTNPLVEVMALEAIRTLMKICPKCRDGSNMEARSQMAWAYLGD
ncbi:MAG: hypothetical protein ACLVJZ_04830 [[Clostridium] leptum]